MVKSMCIFVLISMLLGVAVVAGQAATQEELATKTEQTENKAPAWAKGGTLVYRMATPDQANMLPQAEAGLEMTANLLDGSIRQIPLMNGIIGHDHPGSWNWDGMWPYWNRVTFRAKDWQTLHGFMQRAKDEHNALISFHVNLTDVNAGLRDYPETQAFFKRLVDTGSIYRRDYNPDTRRFDIGQPYVPQAIPADAKDPVNIIALVNYKKFWESGLAKEMIDTFYGHLPYPPPILYLDVLNLAGGNFSTGFPDGPLGGSEQTQLEGVQAIAEYLHQQGTDLATEGERNREVGKWATYVWLHSGAGYSTHDYRVIAGAAKGSRAIFQQVYGNTGCFVVSPIATTPGYAKKVQDHYARLLAGKPGIRPMPGLSTLHMPNREGISDEFDIPGTGDPFRGDWIDLVNNFYLTGIQELYHIGKGNVRTQTFSRIGVLHVKQFTFTAPDGTETVIPVVDTLPPTTPDWVIKQAKANERLMIESPLAMRIQAPQAGTYRFRFTGTIPANGTGAMNVYVNGRLQGTKLEIGFPNMDWHEVEMGELALEAGENTVMIDSGPIYAKWSDGTTARWQSPSLGTGFTVTNGDVTFAQDYDRMWPDTWSGQRKIYFYSWDGTNRTWKLPQDWAADSKATLYPLTPNGRGKGQALTIADRTVTPKLLPQVPYVLVPNDKR